MSKVYDGIIGLVVGDALGVPFEFRDRDVFKATDMIGYGTYGQPPGTWSDDSSMTIATLKALDCGWVHLATIMKNFIAWLYSAKFTPWGVTFDVGGTTRAAIARYKEGRACLLDCGGKGRMDNGNGALMRILPMAFLPVLTEQDIDGVSGLTHNHEISKAGCRYYVEIARRIIRGGCLADIVEETEWSGEYTRLQRLSFRSIQHMITRDEINSTGYVVDTLEAALFCLLHTPDYRDAVLMAVNLGGDTDTIAAVTGGLAGLMYGVGGDKGVPMEWIKQIPRRAYIKRLCTNFERVFNLES